MEDKENYENLSVHQKKIVDYEKRMTEKILNDKKVYENSLVEIKKQTERIQNLPLVEQRKLQSNMIYWGTTGICYFFIGMFFIKRPRRFWKRLAVWWPSLLIYEWFVITHYFWSVKDKVDADKTTPIEKELSVVEGDQENNKIEH